MPWAETMKAHTVRLGIVGAGRWGPNLMRNLHKPPVSEVGRVIDIDEARLHEVGLRYPGIQLDTDIGGVLGDHSIDAVVIATPTRTHFDLARSALDAGKHVLVEKPLTHSSASAQKLCAIARHHKLVLMVGHVFIYNESVRQVREMLAEGALGRIHYLSMTRTNLGPIRTDVGAEWDLASHDLSIVDYWLQAEPVAVSAVGGSWLNPGMCDAVFATLNFPHDILVHLHVSWLNPRKAREITVVGSRAMLTLDDMSFDEPIRIYDKAVDSTPLEIDFPETFTAYRTSVREGDIRIPRVKASEPLSVECDQFVDSILTGRAPPTDGISGLRVVRILEKLSESIRARGSEVAVCSGEEFPPYP